jgi:hypothetical protein
MAASTFQKKMQSDMVKVMTSPKAFGEAISYTPKGLPTFAISAVIDRGDNPDVSNSPRQRLANQIQITIPRGPSGVETVTVLFDRVSCFLRIGDVFGVQFSVIEIINQDEGAFTLLCER